MNDPWKVLNIRPTRDQHAIDTAWRKLASLHHPDHGGDAETFKSVRAAYEAASKLSATIIEIKTPVKQFKINLQLTASSVLSEKTYLLRWVDDVDAIMSCEVNIPIWKIEWGKSHTLLVKNLKTSRQHAAEIKLEMTLVNDDLILDGTQLIWRPKLNILPVLDTRKFTATLNNQEIDVTVDDLGESMLQCQGYLDNKGEKTNILVMPQYVWPKRDEST
jgi:hypothetical protein